MQQVDIVLTDGFPALSLTLVTEPLRVANRECMEQVFGWRLLSAGGGVRSASSGLEFATAPLDAAKSDVVILLASYHPEDALSDALLRWLKARARAGTLMGCVDTGAMIFAEAGLLTGRPAAVHFEALPGYVVEYPRTMFADRLYDFSPPRFSSAGGVATFDMTLALIAHVCGADLAKRVAEILTYAPSGHLGGQQRLAPDTALPHTNRDLARAVDLMMATLDSPLRIAEIARRLRIPAWKLARLFARFLGRTPAAHYRDLRLTRARNLLRNSHHPVAEIAALCGFDNHESFSRAYRRRFGIQPRADRRLAAP